MNTAASNSSTNADQSSSIVTSSISQSSYIPKTIPSDHAIDSSTSPTVFHDSYNQTRDRSPINKSNSSVDPPHPYMNMAAVAAAFLQGGYNPHMNTSTSSFTNMHQSPQGHTFFPPPLPSHGFGQGLSNLGPNQKPFASPLSVPLQSHRTSRSPTTSSDKSILDDSGIGGMLSSPNLTPSMEGSKNCSGNNNSATNSLKRKLSGNSSHQSVPSSNVNGTGSTSSTPTSTMTRTHQYKKFMKPLLERKRRARINKCLDELKEIMTAALTSQGENVSKLEKADILELTVSHLNKMHQARRLMVSTNRNPLEEIHRFQAGYSSCAQEAASFLLSTPGVDVRISQKLLSHLSTNPLTSRAPFGPIQSPIPPSFPITPPSFGIPSATTSSKTLNDEKSDTTNLSLTSPFQTRLPATAVSRRRSSGGNSSLSGSLISPKPISSSSLPATSPTSSLTLEAPVRSSSFCDTSCSDALSNVHDKRSADIHANLTSSPSSSTFSPGNSSAKDTSITQLTVSIRAETDASDKSDMNNCVKRIKTENFSDSIVETSDTMPLETRENDNKLEANVEMKHVPIKPEPIRLPGLQQHPHSVTEPVWRPF